MNSIGKAAVRLAAAGIAAGAIACGFVPGAAVAREQVGFDSAGAAPGTIIIRTTERRLYLVLGEGKALSYPVGVGRADRQWTGLSSSPGNTCGRTGRRRLR